MPKFVLENGDSVELNGNAITIGCKPGCHLVIENDRRVRDVHLTLRRIGDRWLAESSIPAQVCVDDLGPALWHWVQTPGQIIRLTPTGPSLVYEPVDTVATRKRADRIPSTNSEPLAEVMAADAPDTALTLDPSLASASDTEAALALPVSLIHSSAPQPASPHRASFLHNRLNQVAAGSVLALFVLTFLIAATFRPRAASTDAVAVRKHQDRIEDELRIVNAKQPKEAKESDESDQAWQWMKDAEARSSDIQKRLQSIEQAMHQQPKSEPQVLSADETLKRDLELKVRFTRAMRQWALQHFEPDAVITRVDRVGRPIIDMETHAEARQLETTLRSSARSRGATRSARSLNCFLVVIGRTAFEHEIILKDIRDLGGAVPLRNNLASIKLKLQGNLTDEARSDLLKEHERIRSQLAIHDICAPLQVTPLMVDHLLIDEGLGGKKLSKKLNQGALPLQWPAYLTGHLEFRHPMQMLEAARDVAFQELKKEHHIAATTSRRMIDAVDQLEMAFEREFRPGIETASAGDAESSQLMVAKRFMNRLRPSVYRFLESQSIEDISPIAFQSGTLSELMSFMWSEELRFAEAVPSSEATYAQLFHMMARYYEDLQGLRAAVAQTEKEIRDIQKKSKVTLPSDFDDLPGIPRPQRLPEDKD